MMRPYFISTHFPSSSPTLELDAVGDAWRRWFQPRTKGWCLREGRLKKVSIFVSWNICDSYLCGRLCFAFFVISHFVENIETNNFWRFGQSYFPHFFLKNDKEIFFTCWLLMIMMMSIEKALLVMLIMRIVAAMTVILKRPSCSRPLMTLTKRHNPLEVNRLCLNCLQAVNKIAVVRKPK